MGKIIIIIILILLAALIAGSMYLAGFAVHGPRYSLKESLDFDLARENLRVREAADLPWEPYDIKSFDGYVLHGQICLQTEPSEKFMIFTHGYTVNRSASMKYVCMFRDLGYNCIIYDDRGHGENEPRICTYSLTESRDLMAVIRQTVNRFGDEIILGLHGESLGAATSVRALRYHPPVKFVVSDCGFAEIVPVMQGGLRNMHIPGVMVYPSSLAARVMYGYSFTKARPIDSLPKNQIPVCFIHGAADDFITPDHAERMHAATAGYSELHLFPGAAHAESIVSAPDQYAEVVERFVRQAEEGTLPAVKSETM